MERRKEPDTVTIPRNYLPFPNRFFQIGGRQDGPSFHGAIKSVKVLCDDAR